MKWVLGVIVCVGFLLSSAGGRADTFFQYRDPRSGRDVFVNSLDQVPRKYRSQAKVVLEVANNDSKSEDGAPAPADNVAAKEASAPEVAAEQARAISVDLRKVIAGKNLLKDGPAIAMEMMNARLMNAGTTPLTEPERAEFGRLLLTVLVMSVVAGLIALVVWIVMLVSALRDGHPLWALFIFLLPPLAYIYLFVHAGKGRWSFKIACAFGMLLPALVGLGGALRFSSWFHAVIHARGGHV